MEFETYKQLVKDLEDARRKARHYAQEKSAKASDAAALRLKTHQKLQKFLSNLTQEEQANFKQRLKEEA